MLTSVIFNGATVRDLITNHKDCHALSGSKSLIYEATFPIQGKAPQKRVQLWENSKGTRYELYVGANLPAYKRMTADNADDIACEWYTHHASFSYGYSTYKDGTPKECLLVFPSLEKAVTALSFIQTLNDDNTEFGEMTDKEYKKLFGATAKKRSTAKKTA